MITFCDMRFHCDQLTIIRQEMNIFISPSNNCLIANTKNRFQLSLVRKDKNKTLKIIISFCCQTLRNWPSYYTKGLNSCASQIWRSPQLPSNYIFFVFLFSEQNCHFNTIQIKFGTFWSSGSQPFFGPEPNFKPQSLQEPQPNKRKFSISLVQRLQTCIFLSY